MNDFFDTPACDHRIGDPQGEEGIYYWDDDDIPQEWAESEQQLSKVEWELDVEPQPRRELKFPAMRLVPSTEEINF